MNIQQSYHHNPLDLNFCQVIKSRNDLKISRIDYLKDTQRGQLVIFLESNLLHDREVNALLQGNNLIIEAPRSLEYEKPFKTHLMDKESLSDYDKGILAIGFSEVHLNPGFRYTILSCRMINPGLLKVTLGFHPVRKNSSNTIN
jgi:hypothetical protein